MNEKEAKTVMGLHQELSELIDIGLGTRYIYEEVKVDGYNKLMPFNKKLIVPTVLDKALSDSQLNEKQHIIFM